MPNNDTKGQDTIWRLVFASSNTIAMICRFRELLDCRRASLESALHSMLADEESFNRLEEMRSAIFGSMKTTEFFNSHHVEAVARVFEERQDPNSPYWCVADPDKALRFQLNAFLLRICEDFLAALDLYKAHRDAFNRKSVKICVRSDFTGEINWKVAQDATEAILLEEFDARFQSYRAQGEAYYRSKLHNEALTIAYLISESTCETGRTASAGASGVLFEQECTELLARLGYTVRTTKETGDFGVDIVAERSGLSFAIQCKRYSQPVGIAGIQEVLGGRKHYKTDYAVVISTSGFTTAARELAGSSKVVLVSVRDLENLEALARYLDHGIV